MIFNSGCEATFARFSNLPVEQSSITTTDLPSASKRSTRCDPMNPAPPVTSTCLLIIPVSLSLLATYPRVRVAATQSVGGLRLLHRRDESLLEGRGGIRIRLCGNIDERGRF